MTETIEPDRYRKDESLPDDAHAGIRKSDLLGLGRFEHAVLIQIYQKTKSRRAVQNETSHIGFRSRPPFDGVEPRPLERNF